MITIPIIVTLFIWAVIALAIAIWCLYMGVRFLKVAREEKHTAETFVKETEVRTKKEYNKIATIKQSELNTLLAVTFARKLVLCSDQDISEKDPDAHEALLAHAQSAVIKFLGEETVAAIDYYYGKDYIHRWCHDAYLGLEHDMIASSIIKKEQGRDVKSVARHILEWF